MGTRADFYLGIGKDSQWFGSICFDGYPDGVPSDYGIQSCRSEKAYLRAVRRMLKGEARNATLPEHGWPWPWPDSRTTDYAYTFDRGHVRVNCFGHGWVSFKVERTEAYHDLPGCGDGPDVFPNMSERKAVTIGPRSGLLVVSTR